MAELIKCLPQKNWNLNLSSRADGKELSMGPPLNPALGKQRQADPWGFMVSQFSLLGQ